MVLDVCPPLPSPPEVDPARGRAHRGVGRAGQGRPPPRTTRRCSASCRAASARRLRAESAQRTVELDFDGYGIGGLSVGETRAEMLPALAAALAHLPADRPRYLMGVGDPASLVEAVGARRRPVRLRDADPARPPRHGAHRRRASCTSRTPSTRSATSRSTPTAPARCAPATAAATSATCSRSASRPRPAWSACTTSPGRCS